VGELKKLIEEGKIKYIGLSEASAATIRRAHGDDVCPIPGTTKIENFNQNIGALSVKLTPEDMSELEAIASTDAVKGDRYMAGMSTFKGADTPPLSSWKSE
ncbi:unnamed protein product, partial [Linum tenue]